MDTRTKKLLKTEGLIQGRREHEQDIREGEKDIVPDITDALCCCVVIFKILTLPAYTRAK